MKKLSFFVCALAAVALCFTSCKDKNKQGGGDLDDIVENGFYVVGEGCGFTALDAKCQFGPGVNEVSSAAREGMYEKYVVLEANKDFQFVKKEGSNKVYYGAALEYGDSLINTDNQLIAGYKGALVENVKMQVKTTGLYHIVLDFDQDGSLAAAGGKQIIVVPVEWGVRGGMNSWGFTAATEVTAVNAGTQTITYTWKDQDMPAAGEFKFAHNNCWKINLDIAEQVKANANLGEESKQGGANIKVDTAGLYDITLTFTLAKGEIKNGYAYTTKLTKASTLPTTMYMIGAAWGNWDWTAAGIVEMIPVHSHSGMFWCTRYFKAADGFKFCAKKEWSGDFYGRATNNGLGTAWKQQDGNCFVLADGLYTVIVDMSGDVLTIKPAAIYGIGEVFGGWDEATYPFTINADGTASIIASLTLPEPKNLRMYSDIDNTGNWWQSEFNIFSGNIVYRGAGNDQDAVPVSAGQQITLDFNAGTGTIVDAPK